MPDDDDWRLTGQEEYLAGSELRWSKWWNQSSSDDWDHDHCEFCMVHFAATMLADDPETQLQGYTDGSRWICRTCFGDFQERFGWVVTASPGGADETG